jgi:hypothetical protein
MEMWKIKLRSWRDSARIYARSGIALLRSLLFPAQEMRGLEKRLAAGKRAREDVVLRLAGRWFGLLGSLGLRPSCLTRSLTLARVLRQEGHDAHLVFGVRGDNGDMEGHCWVAVDDRHLTDAPESFEELQYG